MQLVWWGGEVSIVAVLIVVLSGEGVVPLRCYLPGNIVYLSPMESFYCPILHIWLLLKEQVSHLLA